MYNNQKKSIEYNEKVISQTLLFKAELKKASTSQAALLIGKYLRHDNLFSQYYVGGLLFTISVMVDNRTSNTYKTEEDDYKHFNKKDIDFLTKLYVREMKNNYISADNINNDIRTCDSVENRFLFCESIKDYFAQNFITNSENVDTYFKNSFLERQHCKRKCTHQRTGANNYRRLSRREFCLLSVYSQF